MQQQLALASQQLLENILLNPVHIKPLADLCTLDMTAGSAVVKAGSRRSTTGELSTQLHSADDVGRLAVEPESAAAPQAAGGAHVPRSFHAQLFQVRARL